MSRETELTTYVEDDLKRELQRRADQEDLSLSAYVAQVLDRHVHEQELAEKSREFRAEQRITNLVAEAHDKITQDTEQMRELLAKQAVYTVALWELEKRDFGDVARQDALSVGAQRLRGDIDRIGADLDVPTD